MDLTLKPKGNGRWFYFWYQATPETILDYLAEYGKITKQEILDKKFDKYQLHDYAEAVGLIQNDNDFDRSPVNDAYAHAATSQIEYVILLNKLNTSDA